MHDFSISPFPEGWSVFEDGELVAEFAARTAAAAAVAAMRVDLAAAGVRSTVVTEKLPRAL